MPWHTDRRKKVQIQMPKHSAAQVTPKNDERRDSTGASLLATPGPLTVAHVILAVTPVITSQVVGSVLILVGGVPVEDTLLFLACSCLFGGVAVTGGRRVMEAMTRGMTAAFGK
ncbi:hypothetical protein AB0L99_33635 [Streptomyces sp. NPDC051954]|uniref:hypothetical protein n=1 Tax=Streptomyces sp. NPDC051954 TaxID=3155524 RepID=UPI003449D234